jgi:hypothetical protein
MVKNGDIWDIGQTVNGNSKWYYVINEYWANQGFNRKSYLYEYDSDELVNLVNKDDGFETELVGNIFNGYNLLDNQCDCKVKSAIREWKLNNILK